MPTPLSPIRIELPTEFPVGPVNAYLFTEPEPVLIDTGAKFEPAWKALEAGLMAHGLRMGDIAKVIITHPHVDHFGQAARIAANSDAEIWVSELGEEWLLNTAVSWQKRINYYRDYFLPKMDMPADMQDAMLGFMRFSRETADPVPTDRLHTFALDARLTFGGAEWQSVHTPGHASHQTCFYQPESRQFLAADMLLEKTPTPVIERPASGRLDVRHDPSLPRFLDALTAVNALDIATVYPGHGEPFDDHRALIARQQHRISRRKAKTRTLIEGGYDTVTKLVNEMYSHYPSAYRLVGLWMQVGYLDLLLADNAIHENEIDGLWRYTVA
jgi:glyoxylase-like metal-dependent hydrolase (beta-lactamase superfamily II)